MKKITGFLSLAVLLVAMACSDKPAEVKKEVIVVPSTVLVKDPEKPTTTVIVDKNGVKVVAKKLDVTVKKQ
jgi:hypothetical protein